MTRVLIYTLLGYLLLTVLAPLQQLLGMEMVMVDVPLIIVLQLAMIDKRGGAFRSTSRYGLTGGLLELPGVIGALLLGYVTDVLGGGYAGMAALTLGGVFIAGRMMARQVYMTGAVSQFLVAFVASLAASIFSLAVRWILGVAPGLGIAAVVLGQAIVTAIAAPPLMRLLRFIDAKLSAEQADRTPLNL